MIRTIAELQRLAYENSSEKGFWKEHEVDPSITDPLYKPIYSQKCIPEKIALIHQEASEALDHYRSGNIGFFESDKGKPDGFGVELADIVIRVADLAEAFNIDLTALINLKHDYNRKRPHMHGRTC